MQTSHSTQGASIECTIVKVQNGDTNALARGERGEREERNAISELKMTSKVVTIDNDEGLSFVQRGVKRQRLCQQRLTENMDGRFVVPTSNVCVNMFFQLWAMF